jgi:HAD superfamily hydrolase (TIGR01484 family)
MNRYLLATDLDGTLLPLEDTPEWDAEILRFRRLAMASPCLLLAYVTDRRLEFALDGAAGFRLPLPELLVCDLGTSVYRKNGRAYELDQGFRGRLLHAWQGRVARDIAPLLGKIEGITPRGEDIQGEFKQSYYTKPGQRGQEAVAQVAERLRTAGLDSNLVCSVDVRTGTTLLDVMPAGAAKDHALAYLRDSLAIPHDHIVFAGDSGHDLAAFSSGFNAIVVANATDEVREESLRQAEIKGVSHRLYFSGHSYIRGVMDGGCHFKIFSGEDA